MQMKTHFLAKSLGLTFLLTLALGSFVSNLAADDYAVDPFHSGVTFRIAHLGLTWIHGRFNEYSGNFTLDKADPSKSSVALTIKAESVDTAVKKRDDHLRAPDFFDVKQYPEILFKSTAVKAIEGGYEVTGEFSMHGKVKSITFKMLGGKTAEFPKGVHRIGFYSDLKIKRSDFGVGDEKFAKALGDDIHIAVSLEGTKK
jgi:polyisoprenoid-binding protein YceI